MKRYVIIGVVFILLIAIVFGMTLINEMAGDDSTKKIGVDGGASPGARKAVGNIFDFKSSSCTYDPKSEDLQSRMFRGFYEEGDEESVNFWYRNNSPEPITVSAKASCVSCSGARIANVSPEQLASYSQGMAIGGIVSPGLFGAPNPFQMLAALEFDSKLPWINFDVKNPNSTVTLPGTKVGDKEGGMGIFQMRIKASRSSSPTPDVTLHASVPNEPAREYKIGIKYTYIPAPFGIRPTKHDVGELSDATPTRSFDIITWSPVREFGERFNPQVLKVDDPMAPIEIAKPERLSEAEMLDLSEKLAAESKAPMRVSAGYKHRITYSREKNGQLAEIGPFERVIEIAGDNNSRGSVTVVGSNVGFFRLRDNSKIDFGTFEAQYEKVVTAVIVSDKPDVDLEVLAGETRPRFLKPTLAEPVTADGVRTWKLTLRIDARAGFGQFPTNAVVALRTVGANPITLRIPVTGNGARR